jgi:hypothetical protein
MHGFKSAKQAQRFLSAYAKPVFTGGANTAPTYTQNQNNSELEILYVTDRTNEPTSGQSAVYNNARSTAATFGVATVGMNPEVDWRTPSSAVNGVAQSGIERVKNSASTIDRFAFGQPGHQ